MAYYRKPANKPAHPAEDAAFEAAHPNLFPKRTTPSATPVAPGKGTAGKQAEVSTDKSVASVAGPGSTKPRDWASEIRLLVQKGDAAAILELHAKNPSARNAIEQQLFDALERAKPALLVELNRRMASKSIEIRTFNLYRDNFYGTDEAGDTYFSTKYPTKGLTQGLEYLKTLHPTEGTSLAMLRAAMVDAREPALKNLARTKYVEAAKAHLAVVATVDELSQLNPDHLAELDEPIRERFIKAFGESHLDRCADFGVSPLEVLTRSGLGHDALLALWRRTKDGGLKEIIGQRYLAVVGEHTSKATATELARIARSGLPQAAELAKRAFVDRFGKDEAYADFRPAFGLPALPKAAKQERKTKESRKQTEADEKPEPKPVPPAASPEDPGARDASSSGLLVHPGLGEDDKADAEANARYQRHLAEEERQRKLDVKATNVDAFGQQVARWIDKLLPDRKISVKGELNAEIETSIPGLKFTTGGSFSAGYKGGKFFFKGALKFGVEGKVNALICEAVAELSGSLEVEVEASSPSAALRVLLLGVRRRLAAINPDAANRVFGEGEHTGGIGKKDKATLSAGLNGKVAAEAGDTKGEVTASAKREYETNGDHLDEGEDIKDTAGVGFKIEGGLVSSEAKVEWARNSDSEEMTFTASAKFPYTDKNGLAMFTGKLIELAQKGGKRAKAIREAANEIVHKSGLIVAAVQGKAQGEVELSVELKRENGKWTGSITLSQTTSAEGETPKGLPFVELDGKAEIASKLLEMNFE